MNLIYAQKSVKIDNSRIEYMISHNLLQLTLFIPILILMLYFFMCSFGVFIVSISFSTILLIICIVIYHTQKKLFNDADKDMNSILRDIDGFYAQFEKYGIDINNSTTPEFIISLEKLLSMISNRYGDSEDIVNKLKNFFSSITENNLVESLSKYDFKNINFVMNIIDKVKDQEEDILDKLSEIAQTGEQVSNSLSYVNDMLNTNLDPAFLNRYLKNINQLITKFDLSINEVQEIISEISHTLKTSSMEMIDKILQKYSNITDHIDNIQAYVLSEIISYDFNENHQKIYDKLLSFMNMHSIPFNRENFKKVTDLFSKLENLQEIEDLIKQEYFSNINSQDIKKAIRLHKKYDPDLKYLDTSLYLSEIAKKS